MKKLVVKKIEQPSEFSRKDGTVGKIWEFIGEDEKGGVDTYRTFSGRIEGMEGKEVEGDVQESVYKDKKQLTFNFPKQQQRGGYGRSPEESERIVRQNATERALEYFTCLGIRPEKLGEVFAVAEVFYQFDTGALKVDAKKADRKSVV